MKETHWLYRTDVIACAGGAAILLLHGIPGAGAALEYREALWTAEPWRLLTAHLVHVNFRHALVNAAAWCIVARLYAPELSPLRQALSLALGAVAIGIALATEYPEIAWYRGLSGALHSLYFAGATVWTARALLARASRSQDLWLPALLLGGGTVKVALEQAAGDTTPHVAWIGINTVPQAHLVGAICGTLLGVLFATLDGRRRSLNRRVA
jgi:rhomboid family GlyGly-CTERM serine protease